MLFKLIFYFTYIQLFIDLIRIRFNNQNIIKIQILSSSYLVNFLGNSKKW